MKYLIVVADGAGDEEIEELGNKTPLETAKIETIDGLAKLGKVGTVRTVPIGVAPGSDAANLSVMGYDPAVFLTGRSPLEAASMGIEMLPTDVAFRCNLVTLEGEGAYEDKLVADHSAGEISSEEARILIEAVEAEFGTEKVHFYPGVSYRHAMIVNDGDTAYELTPPHDILTQQVGSNLPKGEGVSFITDMMKRSFELLSKHPVNLDRERKGLNPANSIWIWGQGRKPSLSSFFEKYHIKGATISAVDLIKGIGICAGLRSIDVEGATGTISTNFDGKAAAAVAAFEEGEDFIYLHLEAPDECSHQGDLEGKIKSLELIDEKVVKPVVGYLKKREAETGEPFRILVLPDHKTPIAIRTHSAPPVPFVLYDSSEEQEADESRAFSETSGETGMYFDNGYELADYFFQKK